MGVFDSIAGKVARLATGNVTLADARRRHEKRKDMRTLFDYEAIRRDHAAGKIAPEWLRWFEMVVLTEAGTPVYTALLTSLEDSDRPEFADFKTFVTEIWTEEEGQHGDVCRAAGEALGFDFDVATVRHTDLFRERYHAACPPCKRVLGTAAYTVVQEEITYQGHRAYADNVGSKELARLGHTIAAEERYHSLFYANRLREVIGVLRADGLEDAEIFEPIAATVQNFNMPTEFHKEAYERYVRPGSGKVGVDFIRAHMGEIKRQLGPLFVAAGGISLVRAIMKKGVPLGTVEAADVEALALAAR